MRLRRDTGGEISVFEDLQTLVVVVVGIVILLSSTLYNWSAISSTEEEQDLYDEAEHIVKQIESNDRLRALNSIGSPYPDFYIQQSELSIFQINGGFTEEIRSDHHYNITFQDLVLEEDVFFWYNTSRGDKFYSYFKSYSFGEQIKEDSNTVVLQVQYAMVMDIWEGGSDYDVSVRHACLVTVVVWS